LPGLVPSTGVVPPGVPGAVDDPCGTTCTFDQAAAKALLAQAFPSGQVPTVEIDTDDDPADVAVAQVVQVDLAAVGIPVQLKAQPFADYQKFITSGNQQLFRTGWVGLWPSPGAYLGPLFNSKSLDNSTAFASAPVDAQLATAMATASPSARHEQYGATERTIMSQSAVVPLASYRQVVALSGRVRGYAGRLDGTFDVNAVNVGGT
jgi:ABC-type transport system substrate-binding protein